MGLVVWFPYENAHPRKQDWGKVCTCVWCVCMCVKSTLAFPDGVGPSAWRVTGWGTRPYLPIHHGFCLCSLCSGDLLSDGCILCLVPGRCEVS